MAERRGLVGRTRSLESHGEERSRRYRRKHDREGNHKLPRGVIWFFRSFAHVRAAVMVPLLFRADLEASGAARLSVHPSRAKKFCNKI